MEMILVLAAILQSMAISLGVGSSTLAIINFFVAIADGKIDEKERAMMGIVYTVLRIAMILILVTSLFIGLNQLQVAQASYFSPFVMGVWTLIFVLYLNSILMTRHIMPSNIGPALQASTWYTIGILMSLIPIGLTNFSYFEFLIGYLAAICLAVAVVNGTMSYLKKQKTKNQQ
jgi:hypothetical protein